MTLDHSRIQALCFDVDGTLSDTDDQFVQRLSRWLRWARFLFPRQDPLAISRRLVMSTEAPANALYGFADRSGIDGWLAAFGEQIYRLGLHGTSKPFSLISGVHEMLTCLQGRYPMSIVSARGQRSTMAFLEQFQLAPFFSAIATAQTCRHTKPYPDPILWAAQRMGVAPEKCLMIGDTTVDIRAGKAAQAQAIGVLCGFGEAAELQRWNADVILPTTSDLVPLLLSES